MKKGLMVGLCGLLVGCGYMVRGRGDEVWYVKGNLLFTTEGGKQQLDIEMYGEKKRFWVIEGREPLLSGRLFWFLAREGGTNYIVNEVQKEYLFFVSEEWNDLFLEVIPLFLEKDVSDTQRENGWLASYQKGQWLVMVRKRFSDGSPRILVVEGGSERIFLDLKKIERRPYHIPKYEGFPWTEVHLVPHGSVWEVIYEQ
ncbi:MAG: hypothetical protein ACK4HQ_07500 [Brevinematales bacterium]